MTILLTCYNFITTYIIKLFDYFERHRIIKDRCDEEPYLERYYIFLKDRTNFPFNIFIHKILKSDPDDLHDHPWSYFTFILRGGYWEITKEGRFWKGPFTFRWNNAKSLHRIELDPNVSDCWTIFIPGQKQREWGFMTKNGWIENNYYLNNKKKTNMKKE